MKMLYSFDIYDTLICRKVYRPIDIFALLQKEISNINSNCPNHIIENFASYRVDAEKIASQCSETGEKSIDDIYLYFKKLTNCSEEIANYLKERELQLEKKLVYPIIQNVNQLKTLVSQKEKVILISDMYLREDSIREILIGVDEVFRNIDIYVSVDYGCSKSNGLLYKYIKDKYEIDYIDWIHIGDNEVSDCIVPEMLGIRTELFKANDRLNTLLNSKQFCNESIIEDSIFQGLLKRYSSIENINITGILCGFIMYDYVKWILTICEERNVDGVLFIARDGFILEKIANIIIKKENKNIHTSYIYGSRIAWRADDVISVNNAKAYFEQEQRPYRKCAFVDLLATGTSFEKISNTCDISGDYFCYSIIGNGKKKIPNWYIYTAKSNNNKPIEVLCRALHGQTLGYELNENNKWVPILDDFYVNKEEEVEYNMYLNTIIKTVNEIENINVDANISTIYRRLAKVLLQKIFDAPVMEVSEFIGDIKHDGYNTENIKYAPYYSVDEILNIKKGKHNYVGGDQDYSEKRLGKEKLEYAEKSMKTWYKEYIDNSSEKEKKIVLYGAGKIGRKAFTSVVKKNIGIVSWVDRDYKRLSEKGYPVTSLKIAKAQDYDYLLLALNTNNDNIKTFLNECGIPLKKIRNYNVEEWDG